MEHQESVQINSTALSIARIARKIFGKNFLWPTLLLYAICPQKWLLSTNFANIFLHYKLSGCALLIAGLIFRFWSHTFEKKGSFVLDGPYRYVRNPVELGSALLIMGTGLCLNTDPFYMLCTSALAICYMNFTSKVYDTEIYLALGTMYLRYKKRVRRWIPSRLPGINRSQENFKLLRGLRHSAGSCFYILGIFVIIALRNHFSIGKHMDHFLEKVTFLLSP